MRWYVPRVRNAPSTTVWESTPHGEVLIATCNGDQPLAKRRADALLIANAPAMRQALAGALADTQPDDPREWVHIARQIINV